MLETEAALESALRSGLFKEQTVWLLQRPGRGNERPTHRGERTDSLCRGGGEGAWGGRLVWAERSPTHGVCLRHVQAWVQMCEGESVRERTQRKVGEKVWLTKLKKIWIKRKIILSQTHLLLYGVWQYTLDTLIMKTYFTWSNCTVLLLVRSNVETVAFWIHFKTT